MLSRDEERSVKFMLENADALIDLDIERRGEHRFFPVKMAWRITESLTLPGKDMAGDGRIKYLLFLAVKDRAMRKLRKTQNGLRLYIPIGGDQWQYAPATTAGRVRVFRNNYAEIQQSAGARKDRLDEVLAKHEETGLSDEDPITMAYQMVLDGFEEQAA